MMNRERVAKMFCRSGLVARKTIERKKVNENMFLGRPPYG